jgi:hypothetical protein
MKAHTELGEEGRDYEEVIENNEGRKFHITARLKSTNEPKPREANEDVECHPQYLASAAKRILKKIDLKKGRSLNPFKIKNW